MELCHALLYEAFERGLVLLSCGASVVRIIRPLNIASHSLRKAWRSSRQP